MPYVLFRAMLPSRAVSSTPIFQKIYAFYRLIHSHYSQIPKIQRYTLWQRCDYTVLLLLTQLIQTNTMAGPERVRILQEMSTQVDLLKVLIRLAQDTRAISTKQYLSLQAELQAIGKMLGGWIKSVAH